MREIFDGAKPQTYYEIHPPMTDLPAPQLRGLVISIWS